MSSVLILAGIGVIFTLNLWATVGGWREYHDLRAIRAVLTATVLLIGVGALAVAAWSLDHASDGELREILRVLVGVGEGVLGIFGLGLAYSYFRERR